MVLHKINQNKGTQLFIIRDVFEEHQIRSKFIVFDNQDQCIYSGVALELNFLNNRRNISSIPAGSYLGVKLNHYKFGNCIQIPVVYGRSGIFIHTGNLYNQIEGCILPGQLFKDINNDNLKDTVNSAFALHNLYMAMQKEFDIIILECRYGLKK